MLVNLRLPGRRTTSTIPSAAPTPRSRATHPDIAAVSYLLLGSDELSAEPDLTVAGHFCVFDPVNATHPEMFGCGCMGARAR
jgi:hypothetical protein